MTQLETDRPILVQSDRSILLEVHSPAFALARADISRFAELVKSPEHIHTYQLTPLSLWNGSAIGLKADQVCAILEKWSKYSVPNAITFYIHDTMHRYGLIMLLAAPDKPSFLYLSVPDEKTYKELLSHKQVAKMLIPASHMESTVKSDFSRPEHASENFDPDCAFFIHLIDRGELKLQMIKIGYPVEDRCPLRRGDPLHFGLRSTTKSGYQFVIREYQQDARDAFLASGNRTGGYGIVVLPCGSGKTIVGISILDALQTQTLIVTTNTTAVHQWISEILDKTDLSEDQIGEYTGERKDIRPITVCTYQILTWRPSPDSDFPHFGIFQKLRWGLIIYDEVHVLPAPVFKITAEIQAISRLGLTATLVREDRREDEVFSLVGPKRCDVPWRELEQKGWIAEANCYEIRIPLPESLELKYAVGSKKDKFRIASENPGKIAVVKELISNHPDEYILVIGQYIDQLKLIAAEIRKPLITGSTPTKKREELYAEFKAGTEKILIVSKVANFAIDLPDASIAIQLSGTFGSRQEEAQRLGRILRPKERGSRFYSIITRYSVEEEFSANRQKFLVEQGYQYHIEQWE